MVEKMVGSVFRRADRTRSGRLSGQAQLLKDTARIPVQLGRLLRRIGLSDKERRSFDLHAVLDIKHSEDWNRDALRPHVEEDPRRAPAIVEGALMRLHCGKRCFERYRQALRE